MTRRVDAVGNKAGKDRLWPDDKGTFRVIKYKYNLLYFIYPSKVSNKYRLNEIRVNQCFSDYVLIFRWD